MSDNPVFQAPGSDDPPRGEPTAHNPQGPILDPPAQGVPDTPQNRRHAAEARELDEKLYQRGINAERVAPTRDHRGIVKLTFADLRSLLNSDKESHGTA